MNDISTIHNKILNHYMGAYDLISGDFKNKTVPILKKLETSSQAPEDFVDLFLNSKICSVCVTFVETGEKWNPIQEPLILFLSCRTHWNFWAEGFNDYLIRTEGNNTEQSSVLFEENKTLKKQEKEAIKQWLLFTE
ncbi:hypothetical protein MNB_SUP05-SYMBIONT-5-371 [hydrothermal vent metagenome]|uniref:Uncharacterized protein n=1 Tax=hydrothermal vent metagenome TaxID=652676 RepID=A0A1W1E5I7_9ZZZZ